MTPNEPTNRRRSRFQPRAEALEGRELLTSGAGSTFALLPGTIAQPNGSQAIPFDISSTNFKLPHGHVALGIDVVGQTGSKINPLIVSVTDPHQGKVNQAFHSIYNPHLAQNLIAGGAAGTEAMIAPVGFAPGKPGQPARFQVNVGALNQTSGSYLLGFYLPGDANGDGTVDRSDLQAIRSAMGATVKDPKYNFDADANRDGRIGPTDLALARQNMGVTVNVDPMVTANLDPASDAGAQDRITNIPNVHFSGQATPGASITYAEVNQKTPPVTTTADSSGNYSLLIPLGLGSNTFQITASDGFGQVIAGRIASVFYTPDAVPPAPATS